jgi:hypothetical protein
LARWNPASDNGIHRIANCDQTWSMVIPKMDHECLLQDVVIDVANRLAKLEYDGVAPARSAMVSRLRLKADGSDGPHVETRVGRLGGVVVEPVGESAHAAFGGVQLWFRYTLRV